MSDRTMFERLPGRAAAAVSQAAGGRPLGWAARLGLAARGTVYVLIGILAFLVARGSSAEADQKGALEQVLAKPFGGFLVGLMAVGFACYALWRLSEAASGVHGEGDRMGPRIKSLVRGLVYAGLAFTAVSLLMGSRTSQSGQQQTFTAQVMAHPGGQWAVGIVGAIVAVVGVALGWEGLRLKFLKYFPQSELTPRVYRLVRSLGRVGNIARGAVFAVAGVLVVVAARTYQPAKAAGLDGALKTLRDQPFGPVLLFLAAAGLIAFGLYGLLEARYRRV